MKILSNFDVIPLFPKSFLFEKIYSRYIFFPLAMNCERSWYPHFISIWNWQHWPIKLQGVEYWMQCTAINEPFTLVLNNTVTNDGSFDGHVWSHSWIDMIEVESYDCKLVWQLWLYRFEDYNCTNSHCIFNNKKIERKRKTELNPTSEWIEIGLHEFRTQAWQFCLPAYLAGHRNESPSFYILIANKLGASVTDPVLK